MFEVRNLKKNYYDGDKKISPFDNLSFNIAENCFFSICGTSGSGKSTLLQLISGLDKPDSGSIVFLGMDICKLNSSQLSKLRLNSFGFVFQTPHFISYKTVVENVLLPSIYADYINTDLLGKRAVELLNYVGLGGFEYRNPATLSGGELQRMVFARSLLMEPDVIFADEPTASLDRDNAERLLSLLTEQKDKGKTIVMVSHDINTLKYSDVIYDLTEREYIDGSDIDGNGIDRNNTDAL